MALGDQELVVLLLDKSAWPAKNKIKISNLYLIRKSICNFYFADENA